MNRAPRPGTTSGNPKPDGASPEAPGLSAIPRQQALRFLTGEGQLTQAAMVGLHQALGAPALVKKVIAAAEAPGLISPITGSVEVQRPVETTL